MVSPSSRTKDFIGPVLSLGGRLDPIALRPLLLVPISLLLLTEAG